MIGSFELSITNYQFSMIKHAADNNVCKLLNENSMKIVNCKLKIERPKGAFDGKY